MQTIDSAGIDDRVMNCIRFHAGSLIRRRARPGMDLGDYQQDLLADLLHRRRAFNPRVASFATFADRVISHRSSTLATATARTKAEREWISLEAPVGTAVDVPLRLVECLADEAVPIDDACAIRIDVGRFVAGLTSPLRDCCDILLAENVSRGARAAGVSRSTAYERIGKLREQARASGLFIYSRAPDTLPVLPVCDVGECRRTSITSDSGGGSRSMLPGVPALLSLAESDFWDWLATATPGHKIQYYRGFLGIDVIAEAGRLPEHDRGELARVADRARWAAGRGLVNLVQRRHGHCDYSYFAVARASGPDLSVTKGAGHV